MKVQDLMTQPVVIVTTGDTCRKAAQVMRNSETGALIVVDKAGTVRGIVTDRDIIVRCVALGSDPEVKLVRDVCDLEPVTVAPDVDAEDALELMETSGVRRLPVVASDHKPVGMLSMDDVARHVRRYVDSFTSVAAQYSHA